MAAMLRFADGVPKRRLAERMRAKSECIAKGPPAIYKLPIQDDFRMPSKDEPGMGIAKCHISLDNPRDRRRDSTMEKVLMVVGATGAGKSTLINGMVNYILGVRWEDDFRFKLIADEGSGSQAHSQTRWITAYTFHKQEGSDICYTMTIIDTPGFGDTEGLRRDRLITYQIKEFFSIPSPHGIDQLHAIGFVTQASLARLTPTQKYVFDSILAIFGKDIGSNIFMMTTFADGKKAPVLAAIKEAEIPFCKSFKFNNSALFPDAPAPTSEDAEEEDDADFNKMFWDMGFKSFDGFFKHLQRMESRSLQLTREVLKEREQLETVIQGLQPQIQAGLSKIDELRQEEQMLEQRKVEIMQNKDFVYPVTVTKQRKIDLHNEYVTNCLACNFTCHYPCGIAADSDKYYCSAMSSGQCTVCPDKCHWQRHFNNPYRFELYKVTIQRTLEDLKKRYDQAQTGKFQVESIMASIESDLEKMGQLVFYMVQQAQQSLQRLDEIALKPNPLTELEYIDLLIKSEEQQARPGYKKRVEYFQLVRQQAQLLSKLKQEKGAQEAAAVQKQSAKWWASFKFW